MLIAVNTPPGCPRSATRPSPDLFGLTDAESKAGCSASPAGACAVGVASAPRTTPATINRWIVLLMCDSFSFRLFRAGKACARTRQPEIDRDLQRHAPGIAVLSRRLEPP